MPTKIPFLTNNASLRENLAYLCYHKLQKSELKTETRHRKLQQQAKSELKTENRHRKLQKQVLRNAIVDTDLTYYFTNRILNYQWTI